MQVERFDHDNGPFDFARNVETVAMMKLRGLCGVLMLLVVRVSGSIAEAGLFRRCHHWLQDVYHVCHIEESVCQMGEEIRLLSAALLGPLCSLHLC